MTISECSHSVETLLIGAIPKDVRSLHYYDLLVLVYVAYRKWQNVYLCHAELPVRGIHGFYLLWFHIRTSSISSTPVILSFFPLRRKVRGTARGVGQ